MKACQLVGSLLVWKDQTPDLKDKLRFLQFQSKPQEQKLLSPTIQEIVFEEEKLLHFIKGPIDDSLVLVTQSEISIIRIKFYGSDISVDEACKATKLPKILDKVS